MRFLEANINIKIEKTVPGAFMTEVIGNYINGTQITTTQGDYQDVFNPATGSVSAQVCMSTTEEVDQAVNVATEAARDWGRTPSPKRASNMVYFGII